MHLKLSKKRRRLEFSNANIVGANIHPESYRLTPHSFNAMPSGYQPYCQPQYFPFNSIITHDAFTYSPSQHQKPISTIPIKKIDVEESVTSSSDESTFSEGTKKN